MRVTRFAALFLGSFLMSLPVVAQQPTPTAPAPRDAQAVALLNQALTAMTVGTVINDATLTVNVTRTSGSDEQTGTGTLSVLGNTLAKSDLQLSGGERQQVIDQSSAMPVGSWSNPDGVVHSTAPWNCWTPAAWFFPVALISNALNTPSIAISYVGTEVKNGQAVTHVRLWQQVNSDPPDQTGTIIAGLSTADLFFSTTSSLPSALDFAAHPDNHSNANLSIEVRFNNYQKLNGVAIPSNIQEYVNNSLFLDFQTQSAKFNSGLTRLNFNLP